MTKQYSRADELIKRLNELKAKKTTWNDIAGVIESEGFSDQGKPYNKKALINKLHRWKKAHKTIPAESSPTDLPEDGPTVDGDTTTKAESDPTSDAGISPTTDAENSRTPEPPSPGRTHPPETDPTTKDTSSGIPKSENSPTLDNALVGSPSDSSLTEQTVGPGETESGMTPEMEAAIARIVRKEMEAILSNIQITEVQKSGRGGAKNTVKKSFSLPLDVWAEFEKRFGRTIASNHVAAALRLYLSVTRGDPRGPD